jgi:hypothetical protein
MKREPAMVPEDPRKPGYDVLGVGLDKRGHFIHEVLARASGPLRVAEICVEAKRLAQQGGYPCKLNTFAAQPTRNHLVYLRDRPGKGFAEQVGDRRWQLTEQARRRIDNPNIIESAPTPALSIGPEVRTVDAKSRLLLPKEFANATVTVERVGENEIRIRKAVVVPVDEFPLIEDQLKPLSDRDRDLFLHLLDNPPEPTSAFLKAAKLYKKRHG